MPHYPSNSTYQTPIRSSRSRSTRKTRSNTQGTQSRTASSRAQNRVISLRAQPPQTCSNLFSLVSKFEALDALSLPIKFPYLQPAPLRISRNSSRSRWDTAGSQTKRLSTIFSPSERRGSVEKEISNNTSASAQNLPSVLTPKSAKHIKLVKKSGSGRLRQSQFPDKAASTRLRGRTRDRRRPLLPEQSNDNRESPVRRDMAHERGDSPVRDKIKFFDGSTDPVNPTNLLSSNPAYPIPSIAVSRGIDTPTRSSRDQTEAPTTPLSRRLNSGRGHNSPKSAGPAPKNKHAIVSPYTTSQMLHTSQAKYRSPFSVPMPNPFLDQTSSTSPIARARSPRISPKSSLTFKTTRRDRKDSSSLSNSREVDVRADRLKTPTPVQRGRSRLPVTKKMMPSPISNERRNISRKIEALYSLKSKEMENQQLNFPPGAKAHDKRPSQHNIKSKRDIFELAERNKKVDIEAPRQEVNVTKASIVSDDNLTKKSSPRIEAKPADSPKSRQIFQQPAKPSPLLTSSVKSPAKYQKTFLAKTAGEPLPPIILPEPSPLASKCVPQIPIANKNVSRKKAMEDRIRHFESRIPVKSGKETSVRPLTPLKLDIGSNVKKRKDFFESPTKPQRSPGEKKMLSMKDINDIVEEVQERISRRQTAIERWDQTRTAPTMSGLTGEVNRVDGAESVTPTTLKFAECVLLEPKPVKMSDMQRMAWMCKGKGNYNFGGGKGGDRSPKKL